MTTKFNHSELGHWNRLIGNSILQSINPNDGQSSDLADKSRYQYTLVNGVLLRRHLPPEAVGDKWLDDPDASAWQQIEVPMWPLILDWLSWIELQFGIEKEPCDLQLYGVNYHNYAHLVKPMAMPVWRKSRIEICNSYWPQTVPCPHCHDWLVWAEAGYVPGYRICRGCHRHWRMTMDSGSDRWTLVRVNRAPFWPYGGVIR